jgi:hypothetical protein
MMDSIKVFHPVPSVGITSGSSFVESLLVRPYLDGVGVVFVLCLRVVCRLRFGKFY